MKLVDYAILVLYNMKLRLNLILVSLLLYLLECRAQIVSLTAKNFNEFATKEKYCIIEFYSSWCVSCETLLKTWKEFAQAFDYADHEILIGIVNVDDAPQLFARFNITAIPDILFINKEGGGIEKYRNNQDLESLIKFIEDKTGIKARLPDESAHEKLSNFTTMDVLPVGRENVTAEPPFIAVNSSMASVSVADEIMRNPPSILDESKNNATLLN